MSHVYVEETQHLTVGSSTITAMPVLVLAGALVTIVKPIVVAVVDTTGGEAPATTVTPMAVLAIQILMRIVDLVLTL